MLFWRRKPALNKPVVSGRAVLWSKQFGVCKRFKILPLFWIELRGEIKFKSDQWCLGYKIFQAGFIAIYYHSPIG
jgi:hypothetical protein